jgi:prepilin-type N-terminal cleavage/methylation domain-containing protein
MEIGLTPDRVKTPGRAAFTLVELILVMTIMTILLSVVFPNLKGFFQGRNLDNEAMQFLALTRYGQNRAVAEGVPVELWVNPKEGSYGLGLVSGYGIKETKPITYTVDSSVKISVSTPPTILVRSNYFTPAKGQFGAMAKIRFQPDGFISDASPENIYLRQGQNSQVWIAEAPTHMEYEIEIGQPSHY